MEYLADAFPVQSLTLSHGPVGYRQSGAGFPLVLLHGWGTSSRCWQQTLAHLADTSHLYALDLPGYGASPPLPEKSGSERLADLVIEFADAIGAECFDLNAHSFGASVAAYVASRWPERVRRLVLTCFSTFQNEFERRMVEQMLGQMGISVALWQPWMSLWHPWMGLWHSWMTLWRPQFSGYVPSIYQTMAWRFFYTIPSHENEAILREGFGDFLRMDPRTSLESIFNALNPTVNDALREITTPTLLVGACQDMIMPPYGVAVVEQLVPDCRLVWIDQCGHVPMLEKPDQYHQLVRAFLLGTDEPEQA
jgi:pimeloyl-ACP methyl ester carboxylesterase